MATKICVGSKWRFTTLDVEVVFGPDQRGVFGQELRLPPKFNLTLPVGCELSEDDVVCVRMGTWDRHKAAERAMQAIEECAAAVKVYDVTGSRGWASVLQELRLLYKQTDELAVKEVKGRLVEPVGQLPFDELGVVYLDYLVGRLSSSRPERQWDEKDAQDRLTTIFPYYRTWNGKDWKERVNPFFYALEEYRLTSGRWEQAGHIENRGRKTSKLSGQGRVEAKEAFDSVENYLTRKLQKSGLEDLDGFSGEDGWVDDGKIAGRTFLRPAVRDLGVDDRAFTVLGTRMDWMADAGPAMWNDGVHPDEKTGRRNGKFVSFSQIIEERSKYEVSSVACEEEKFVEIPLREAFATWWTNSGWDTQERFDAEDKAHFRQLGCKSTVFIRLEGKTLVLPGRWVPTDETYEKVDDKGELKTMPLFHDRWVWTLLEQSRLTLEGYLLALRTQGWPALEGVVEGSLEMTDADRGLMARRMAYKMVVLCNTAVKLYRKQVALHPYFKLLVDTADEVQDLARRFSKGVWVTYQDMVAPPVRPDPEITLELLGKAIRKFFPKYFEKPRRRLTALRVMVAKMDEADLPQYACVVSEVSETD